MVTYLAQNPVNQYPWKLVCFRAGSYCSQHIPMMSCHIEIITDFSCFICLFYLVLHALKHDSCCMFSSFISLLKSHPSFVEAMSHEKKSLSTKTHSYHPKMVGFLPLILRDCWVIQGWVCCLCGWNMVKWGPTALGWCPKSLMVPHHVSRRCPVDLAMAEETKVEMGQRTQTWGFWRMILMVQTIWQVGI